MNNLFPRRAQARICLGLSLLGLVQAAWTAEFPSRNQWPQALPQALGLEAHFLDQARDYALSGAGSGIIIVGGHVVMTWGDQDRRYDLKSTTKSFGSAALGLAMADQHLGLQDKAIRFFPGLGVPPETNATKGWLDKITIEHLASQTAGFHKPGGFTKLLFEPGTHWDYSDSGPNWLADCLTLIYQKDLAILMEERLFRIIGIGKEDLRWRRNAYRPAKLNGVARREFGSGIHANVDAMARFGYLLLRNGRWENSQLIPESFVQRVQQPVARVAGRTIPSFKPKDDHPESNHYGLLWWNNADGLLKEVPKDAYWTWGLYDSLILVVPSLDLVVARAGKSLKREKGWGHYEVLKPFYGPIVAAVRSIRIDKRPKSRAKAFPDAPYPPSPVFAGIEWDDQIVRQARGSDNWPITWGDDGRLYTAYGDGYGFRPKVKRKLSLGLAAVSGHPPDIAAVNIRSDTAEALGDGQRGRKASGLLMVKGVLYMLVRNAGNAQLGWSRDRGQTWAWADWKFEESFGCPTFLNYGRHYEGARDDYVYVYSFDSDSAYQPADHMVLARVPVDRLKEREAYEFYAGSGKDQRPRWTREIGKRRPVFRHPGKCYRSGITYHAPSGRYLWSQVIPGGDTRFKGGFAIYDAPEPWGPWTTVYYTRAWDVGPGETCVLPTKWMGKEGGSIHLVFSGDDCFSVRRGVLQKP